MGVVDVVCGVGGVGGVPRPVDVPRRGHVVNAVVLVATGVNGDGHREVLGMRVAASETGGRGTSSSLTSSLAASVRSARGLPMDCEELNLSLGSSSPSPCERRPATRATEYARNGEDHARDNGIPACGSG